MMEEVDKEAPRSGLALFHGIDVGAGVIDPDYRGEIKVLLFNHNQEEFHYHFDHNELDPLAGLQHNLQIAS